MAKKKHFLKRLLFFILFIILLPVLIVSGVVRFFVKKRKYKKWLKEGDTGRKLLLTSDITSIDIMEGYEFEEYLKSMFFYLGYAVEVTKKSRDYGADLVLVKDGAKIIVQAKRYNKTVGSKAVSEAVGALKHYLASEAWVVTNGHFSEQAETLAKENGIRLIDREELMELSREVCEKLKIDNMPGEVGYNQAYSGQIDNPYRI